jgi:hypothetical protein
MPQDLTQLPVYPDQRWMAMGWRIVVGVAVLFFLAIVALSVVQDRAVASCVRNGGTVEECSEPSSGPFG